MKDFLIPFRAHLPALGFKLIGQSELTLHEHTVGVHTLILEELQDSKKETQGYDIQLAINNFLMDDQQPQVTRSYDSGYLYIQIPYVG